ncbi:MAG: Gfo/Idh/MocA family oxidoreductase [Candidatus Glassbacteria bacterium]|nr:Gfo/Idh/MocA family oxidoreductase [Candidatus Glassbacteria bacterium]
MSMIRVAVIGASTMTRNLVRTFNSLPGSELYGFSDPDFQCRRVMAGAYRGIRVTEKAAELIEDPAVDAVVIAGGTGTHHPLALQSLEAGKHVFVEKPMAGSLAQAEEMADLAAATGRILMVGHLMNYHPAVELLKSLLDEGQLGDILYIYTVRVNLGRVKRDENALWALAPYDIAVILDLLGRMPRDVSARGACYLQQHVEDVVFVNLRFSEGVIANIQLSWLDPCKKRLTTVVGNRKMAVFDDMEGAEKVRIYDKGADYRVDFQSYEEFLTLRNGDIRIPRVRMVEPLLVECQHFCECIAGKSRPRTSAEQGVNVVRVLCAAQESLENGGEPVALA